MPLFNIHRSVIISGSGFIVIVVHPVFVCGFKRAGALFCGDKGILDGISSFLRRILFSVRKGGCWRCEMVSGVVRNKGGRRACVGDGVVC